LAAARFLGYATPVVARQPPDHPNTLPSQLLHPLGHPPPPHTQRVLVLARKKGECGSFPRIWLFLGLAKVWRILLLCFAKAMGSHT